MTSLAIATQYDGAQHLIEQFAMGFEVFLHYSCIGESTCYHAMDHDEGIALHEHKEDAAGINLVACLFS